MFTPNLFTFNTYARLADKDKKGNLFCSPKNMIDALACLYLGASGDTARELAAVCGFPLAPTEVIYSIKALNKALTEQKDVAIKLATAIWAQENFPWSMDYIAVPGCIADIGAEMRLVNYEDDIASIVSDINSWTAAKTDGKITEIISKELISKDTVLVLVAAIYFLGKWAKRFDPAITKEEVFLTNDGEKKVKMMHQNGRVSYGEDEVVQVLDLPYVGEQLSMMFVLPNKCYNLGQIEEVASISDLFDHWLKLLGSHQVEIAIPKWEATCSYQMEETLQDMGIKEAFSNDADFSGAVQNANIKISKVIHKAFVKVTEEGTEAAAATAVMMRKCMMSPKPKMFRADRPFIYLIRHRPTGGVLFIGRCADPTV